MLECLPQDFFIGLAVAVPRNLLKLPKIVRDPPPSHQSLEVFAQFPRVDRSVGHDKSGWALAPSLVRTPDDGCFADGRVGQESRLQVQGTDPLATGLDRVLQSIGDAHPPVRIDGSDV